MTTGATGQLGLALPVQGELSGTWGDTVNNGITQYTNIAIAGTLTLTNDGAVTLANTTGDASASNITSTLTGAGTVTAQFAIVRVTGTLTTAKVVTAPSYSKTYTVVNAATGGIVTFKASGQTGVSIAVGESAFVYFNGTDYVKLAGTVNTGVTSFQTSLSGLTPSTSTTGAVTLAGTLGTSSGGTNLTSFTSGGVVYASSSSALATGSGLTYNGTTLTAVNNASSLSLILSRTDATARNWALGVDGDGAFRLTDTGASGVVILTAGAAGLTTLNSASELVFKASNAEQMRLTSTGLGIGTSSPSAKLSITNSNATYSLTQNIFNASAGNLWIGQAPSATYFSVDNFAMAFCTGSDGGVAGTSVPTNERMRISSAGNVGIGTSSPSYKLDVSNTTATLVRFQSNNANGAYLDFSNGSSTPLFIGFGSTLSGSLTTSDAAFRYSNNLVFSSGSTEKARFSSSGGFSVGTTADPGAGAIYATGNITAYYSDARLKTVSGKIENALDKVGKLSGVYYTNNSVAKSFGYDSDEVQVGVLAQDVEAVLPQIVKAAPFDLDADGNSKSGENYKTVQYERLVPLLIEAINELRAEVKALKGA